MHVGSVDLRGVVENRLQQLDHGRVLRAQPGAEGAEVDVAVADIALQLLRQPADLIGAAINPVDGLQQNRLAHHRGLDIAPQQTGDLVESEKIGRIGHADEIRGLALLEHDCAEAPGLRFGQAAHEVVVEVVELQVDVRDVELTRDRLADLLFVDEALLDQHPPQPPAGLLLLLERDLELVGRDDVLRDERIAEPYFFWPSHRLPFPPRAIIPFATRRP